MITAARRRAVAVSVIAQRRGGANNRRSTSQPTLSSLPARPRRTAQAAGLGMRRTGHVTPARFDMSMQRWLIDTSARYGREVDMTTHDEISQSRRANRRYWNAEVRFRISLIRLEEAAPSQMGGHMGRLYHGLGRALTRRAEYMFLEGAA